MKKIMTAVALMLVGLASVSFGQSNISGFVYDSQSGEALIGANIYISELSTGASSNLSGYYVITNVPAGSYKLVSSYVGYKEKRIEIKIENGKDLKIDLKLDLESIETQEIIVSSESTDINTNLFNKPVSAVTLTGKEVSALPKLIEPDLLRVLQTVPGVTSASDYTAGIYVRGGTPDQNLYLVDGTDVYNPEHAFGIFSTFNTDAIKQVEFYKGGFSAEYGGRLSSLVNIVNLDGNQEDFEGVVNIGSLSASSTLQIPLGKLGSISGSFRRTYLELLKGQTKDPLPDYYFYDSNVKAFLNISENDKLSISFFKGFDDLKIDPKEIEDSPKLNYNWGNLTGSINWKHIFSPKLFSNFWVAGSRFRSKFDLEGENFTEDNNLDDFTAKASFEYYQDQNLSFRLGGEYKSINQYFYESTNTLKVDIKSQSSISSLYLITNWKPNNLWDIEFGVRGNSYSGKINSVKLAPRFSAKYRLNESTNLKFSTGIFHQFINRVSRLFFSSVWSLADKNTPVSESKHFILGAQKTFGKNWVVEAETYFKTYKDLSQFNFRINYDIEPSHYENGKFVYNDTKGVFINGDGKSYGFELTVRKNAGSINGWASYSYSKTLYEFDRLGNGNEFSPRHDRNSTINGGLNSDITEGINSLIDIFGKNEKLSIGIYYVYATGQPITVPSSTYYSQFLPDWTHDVNHQYTLNPGSLNSYRLPAYSRLDASLSYQKDYDWMELEVILQVFNLGNKKNVWFVSYEQKNENGKKIQEVKSVDMFPTIPSLTIRMKF